MGLISTQGINNCPCFREKTEHGAKHHHLTQNVSKPGKMGNRVKLEHEVPSTYADIGYGIQRILKDILHTSDPLAASPA